ncbi:MAG: tripartite tricarboxylate transporter TctB family protein, partial [Acidobacteriota bacterium]
HAAMVTAITTAGIAFYTVLGFLITMTLMIIGLLVIIERRRLLYAAAYSIVVVTITYASFEFLLKTPMPESPFSY